jgi:thioredoxin 1
MEISGIELETKIKNGEKIIVDIYGLWCRPCMEMKPTFEKVASENDTDVQMYTIDVDVNRDRMIEMGVRSVPMIKSFSGGKEVYSKPGIHLENELKELIKDLQNG